MLKDATILKAVRDGKAKVLKDGAGRGSGRLLLSIRPGVRPEWYAQQWSNGRKRLSKIGTFPELSLADAREAFHSRFSPAIRSGTDIRRAVRTEVGTVAELFDDYTEHLKASGKRSWFDCSKNLPRMAALIGPDTPANKVTTEDVVEAIRPTYDAGRKSMACHLRSYIRSAYGWAIKAQNDYRNRSTDKRYRLTYNPAENIPTEPKVPGVRWLSPVELRAVWQWLENGGEPVPGKAATLKSNLVCIQLIIATGQRVEEIARLRPEMVDRRNGLIEWPSTKNGRSHVLPLSATALELLDQVEANEHGWLFPSYRHSDRPVHNQTIMRIVMRYHELHPGEWWCPRDLRRTWKTLSGEAGVSKTYRDLVQNHARHDVSSRHYDRYDYFKEKKEAMDQWDAWFRREIKNQRPA